MSTTRNRVPLHSSETDNRRIVSDVYGPFAKIWRDGLQSVGATDCNLLINALEIVEVACGGTAEDYGLRPNDQGMSWSIRACGCPVAIASSVAFIQA